MIQSHIGSDIYSALEIYSALDICGALGIYNGLDARRESGVSGCPDNYKHRMSGGEEGR